MVIVILEMLELFFVVISSSFLIVYCALSDVLCGLYVFIFIFILYDTIESLTRKLCIQFNH